MALVIELYHVARKVWERIEEKEFYGKTITLKIKYADFEQITKSKTVATPISHFKIFWQLGKQLLQQTDHNSKSIRLMGLTISNLNDDDGKSTQLELDF